MLYQYRFSEQKINEINIETDIAKIYSIDMNSRKQLNLYKETFYDNVPIVVNIKSDNCYLKIENLYLIQYSIEANYYQIFFNEPNDYSFNISSYSVENLNTPCVFYLYPIQLGKDNNIRIMEGVTYNYRLSKEQNVVDFLLPIQVYIEAYLDSISILVNILNRTDVGFLISKDKANFYNDYLSGRNNIIIPKDIIDKLCIYGTICRIQFEIQSKEEAEIYLEFKVSVTRKNAEYVPKNTMMMDRIADSYKRIFYTYISNEDQGKIKFSFNNMD